MSHNKYYRVYLFFLALQVPLFCQYASAQSLKGEGKAADIFLKNCSTCHGNQMQGGMAKSLLDDQWQTDGSDEALADAIRNGLTSAGMPAWKNSLSEEDIRSLVILIREQRSKADHSSQKTSDRPKNDETRITTKLHHYKTQVAGKGDETLWAIDFLPDGSMLVTQKDGVLWRFHKGKRTQIKDTPKVWFHRQGGLLDVMVHPNNAGSNKNSSTSPWVYLAYSEQAKNKNRGATKIVRGKIKDDRWIEQHTLFEIPDEDKKNYGLHFGSRIVYQDGFIYFTTGEENRPETAQDLKLFNGKVHRLHDDGRIPKDNPFANRKDALASIWSYGHRNPQGLDIHPTTGKIYESEHGPRGGDEINIILKGQNYGWPKVTFGMHYDGRPISALTSAPGMEDPIHYWVPSIATCGIKFYNGNKFMHWQNNLFVAGLRSQSLHRLTIEDNRVIDEEVVFQGFGRVRDMAVGPDGYIYVAVNEKNNNRVLKLSPADAKN
ncbi:Aldose sugar dehydrogenase YliI [Thalassocella blandensis]|nr:Aldose sugar dehydrogenase YliI [Thalassocella blandensis]